MAKLNGPLAFTGSLADLTAYKRKDVKGIILRPRSSLDKQRMHSDPAFENTLRQKAADAARPPGGCAGCFILWNRCG